MARYTRPLAMVLAALLLLSAFTGVAAACGEEEWEQRLENAKNDDADNTDQSTNTTNDAELMTTPFPTTGQFTPFSPYAGGAEADTTRLGLMQP